MSNKSINSDKPLYFAASVVFCCCGYHCTQENLSVKDFSLVLWCPNRECSEYMVSKRISLPVIHEYEILNRD